MEKESNFPCIICQGGDPFSNIICSDCEMDIEFRKDLQEDMERLVRINNDIVGHVPFDIEQKVQTEVRKFYDKLNDLKIEGKERCH